MGMGYEKCPDCGDDYGEWYEIETLGMCRHCAKDRMEVLLHTVLAQRTEINRLKKLLRDALQKGREDETGTVDEPNKASAD